MAAHRARLQRGRRPLVLRRAGYLSARSVRTASNQASPIYPAWVCREPFANMTGPLGAPGDGWRVPGVIEPSGRPRPPRAAVGFHPIAMFPARHSLYPQTN